MLRFRYKLPKVDEVFIEMTMLISTTNRYSCLGVTYLWGSLHAWPSALLFIWSTIAVSLQDVQGLSDPLDKVQPGLQAQGSDVPLQAVHIRARLIDLAARVVVMQAYKNNSLYPIEAKYVFPLDDMAAVCGFEAFINGKHIVGVVKEKEQAHREYKEAISKGHGAYLMDEETPVRLPSVNVSSTGYMYTSLR